MNEKKKKKKKKIMMMMIIVVGDLERNDFVKTECPQVERSG